MPAPLLDVVGQGEEVGRVILLNPLIPHRALEAEDVIGIIDISEVANIHMDRAWNESVNGILDRPIPLIIEVTVADRVEDFVVSRIQGVGGEG